jgi:hypothetical protein
MAKYHNTQVNGKNHRQYAYDYIVTQGNTDLEDATLELECAFNMPESAARSLAFNVIHDTNGIRAEIHPRQIAQDFDKGFGISGLKRHSEPAPAPQRMPSNTCHYCGMDAVTTDYFCAPVCADCAS